MRQDSVPCDTQGGFAERLYSTVIRATPVRNNATAEALDGFGCKIHALKDALGLLVRLILTEVQAAGITQAIPLMQGIPGGTFLADKVYDADALLDWLRRRKVAAVIPRRANRKEQRSRDWSLYRGRHVIECMFGKLKYFRRIATRFEKKAIYFKEMLASAAFLLLWLG